MRPFEIDADLEPGRAEPIVVRVVDVEHQVEGPTRQADARDGDLLQGEIGLLERQPTQRSAGGRQHGEGQKGALHVAPSAVAFFLSSAHHSIRCLMSFSNPNSVGSYQLAPRNTAGRYSCGTS